MNALKIDNEARRWLTVLLGDNVRFDEPMARHTSLRVGGPADVLADPASEVELVELVQWAQQKTIPYIVVGGGTNLLVLDGGIRGLTIRLGRLESYLNWRQEPEGILLSAAAGVTTRRLCALALRRGWMGLNFALGIPGTVGGALCMNAGTAEGCMADVLMAVSLLNGRGRPVKLVRSQLDFGYRRLRLPDFIDAPPQAPPIITQVQLRLKLADQRQVHTEARRIVRARAARQAVREPSAGCFFQNPSPAMPAGRLIDEAGCKGLGVRDALVSPRHANFIVNRGQASAADVLALAARIQDAVQKKFGIGLQPEVRIVGQAG